jgi:hypothetical protein
VSGRFNSYNAPALTENEMNEYIWWLIFISVDWSKQSDELADCYVNNYEYQHYLSECGVAEW